MKKFFFPGLIFTVFAITMVILSITRVITEASTAHWLEIVMFFIIFFFLIRNIKIKHYNNNMTFMALFKTGMRLALVCSLMIAVVYYIYGKFINPSGFTEFMGRQMEVQKQKMIAQGSYSLKMDDWFAFTSQIGPATFFSTMMTLFFGTLYALSCAIILKDKKQTDDMGVPLE